MEKGQGGRHSIPVLEDSGDAGAAGASPGWERETKELMGTAGHVVVTEGEAARTWGW